MILESIKRWSGSTDEWIDVACNFLGVTDAELARRMTRLIGARQEKRHTIDSALQAYQRMGNFADPTTASLAADTLRQERDKLSSEIGILRRFTPFIPHSGPFCSVNDALAILRDHCV